MKPPVDFPRERTRPTEDFSDWTRDGWYHIGDLLDEVMAEIEARRWRVVRGGKKDERRP